jgi:hypothetical protein
MVWEFPISLKPSAASPSQPGGNTGVARIYAVVGEVRSAQNCSSCDRPALQTGVCRHRRQTSVPQNLGQAGTVDDGRIVRNSPSVHETDGCLFVVTTYRFDNVVWAYIEHATRQMRVWTTVYNIMANLSFSARYVVPAADP